VHAHGVNIFDKTNGDLLVFGVTDHFQFQFFPAQEDSSTSTCPTMLAEMPRLTMVRNSSTL